MGNGTPKSETTSMATYERACKVYDNAAACHDAGVILGKADENQRDAAVLLDYGKRACELDKRQCDLLAHLLSTGKAGYTDAEEASKWYDVACTNGSDVSCSSLGHRLFGAIGVKKDPRRAIELWVRACSMGHGGACKSAAEQTYYGTHVSKDRKKAYSQFKSGCDHDNAQACHWAGAMELDSTSGLANPKPENALPFLERSCTLGRPQACTALARLYRDGRGVVADERKAEALFKQTCDGVAEGADDDACEDLGQMLYVRGGDQKTKMAAALAYQRACELGKPEPCRWLDGVFREAAAGDGDIRGARHTLENACAKEKEPNEAACVSLALIYREGGFIATKNPRKSAELLRESCDRKHGDACTEFASSLVRGEGVVADAKRAETIFVEQCDAGVTAACAGLGYLEWSRKKHRAAVTLMQRSCDDGVGGACTMVGFASYTAKGTAWDVAASATAWEKACKLGELTGCSNLGEMYEFGIGRPRDVKLAREFYEKGCAAYSTYGCGRAARFYEIGAGVEVDRDRAEREYTRACESEPASPEACWQLAQMWEGENGGSPSAIAKLKQKAFGAADKHHSDNPYYAYLLGKMYEQGVTVVANAEKAVLLYADACDRYDPLGCLEAGKRYLSGTGTEVNRPVAAVRFDRACAAGLTEGCEGAALARKAAPTTPPTPPTQTLPAKVTKRSACACTVGTATSLPKETLPALLLLLALLHLRRRRRSS